MGNEGQTVQERFYSRYGFVQALEDPRLGTVKIYRKKELNFDYVMVIEQRYSSAHIDTVRQQLENIRRSYTLQTDTALLKIINVEELSGKNCQPSSLRVYIEYLNFTLRDAIVMKREARSPFNSQQIMYIIQSAIGAFQFLKKINANHLSLRPDAVFLNPDGLVRFNPLRTDGFPPNDSHCECLPEPQQTIYQKTQRQFLCELKSLIQDLVQICPQEDLYFRKNYQLLSAINHARTFKEVKALLWQPEVDSLFANKRTQTTDLSSQAEKQTKQGLPFSNSNIISNDSIRRQTKQGLPFSNSNITSNDSIRRQNQFRRDFSQQRVSHSMTRR